MSENKNLTDEFAAEVELLAAKYEIAYVLIGAKITPKDSTDSVSVSKLMYAEPDAEKILDSEAITVDNLLKLRNLMMVIDQIHDGLSRLEKGYLGSLIALSAQTKLQSEVLGITPKELDELAKQKLSEG